MEMILNKEKYVAWFGIVFLNLLSWLPIITMGQASEFNYATGNVSGKNYVGGLAGGISGKGTVLRNSFARGSVSGASLVGGLAGNSDGTVINCYSTGSVTGTSQSGGLIGSGNGAVTSAYWDIQTSGQTVSAGGTPRTTDPLTYPYSPAVYTGWDFTTVWKADTDPPQNDGYPFLQPAAVYQVTIRVFPPGTGTATGAGFVKTNGQVQLDAAAATNYVFKGWLKNGAVISTDTRYNLSVTENMALVARFESKTTAVPGVANYSSSGISLYPNPVHDILHIEVSSLGEDFRSFQVLNLNGQVLKVFQSDQPSLHVITIPVSEMNPGVYLIRMRHKGGFEVARFVKY